MVENTPEMVERVKAAIAETIAPAINVRAPYAKVMIDVAARAAIEAMREPTEAVSMAGRLAVSRLPKDALMAAELSADRHAIAKLKMAARWASMIDAALGKDTNPDTK